MAAAARLLDAASGDELSGEGSAPSRRGCAPARRHSAETTLGGICEWQHWHEETEADSWRGTELRNAKDTWMRTTKEVKHIRVDNPVTALISNCYLHLIKVATKKGTKKKDQEGIARHQWYANILVNYYAKLLKNHMVIMAKNRMHARHKKRIKKSSS
uniref:Uncharacterized protein n=1 Tax=Oryza sativa subsp. japonica TaxID=39947 RepID=Q2R479_ORYSJ|nr:hypothetical protein LOC_Os11g29410 [Oryza sativa Japonica Group]